MSDSKRWKIPLYKRLGVKLILVYTLIILCGSIIGVYLSIKIASTEFKKLLSHQFKSTLHITENIIDIIGQTGLMLSKNLAMDSRLNRLIAENDRDKIADYIISSMEKASADALILIDRDGQVIIRGHDLNNYGDSLLHLNMVGEAIVNQVPSTYILQDFQNLIIYSSGIIYDTKNDFAGVLLLGYAINDRFLENLKRDTGIDITIVRDRAVMASTFYEANKRISVLPIQYLEYQMMLSNQNDITEADLFGKKYFLSARNLKRMAKNMSGSILLAYPQDSLIAIKEKLSKHYALLFFSSFLIVMAIGIKLSKKILNPIKTLTNMTNKVAEGDLNIKINIDTEDEIHILAEHFNYMIDAIREKNDALKRYTENLEEMVRKRTNELMKTRDKLYQSEKMATLGQVAGNVAHEILNPISAIISRIEYDIGRNEVNGKAINTISDVVADWEKNYRRGRLEEYFNKRLSGKNNATYLEQDITLLSKALNKTKELSDEQKNDLLFCQKNIERIITIVDNIRRLSRSSRSIESVDLHKAISESIEILSSIITEYNITIISNFSENLPSIRADMNEIIQVFTNVIKNGAQAMREVKNKRRVFNISTKKTNKRVEIRFIDSGIGILEEEKENIFLPTFTTKSASEGTGLGLPISRKIMRSYGGDMEIEAAKPGKGTTFLVWLPLYKGENRV
ncbi:MAG: ATP-binding protein [Nitrospirota bacterium]